MSEREEAAIALLRELEWGDPNDTHEAWWRECPICGGHDRQMSELYPRPVGHKADCRLGNLLNTVLVAKL